MRKRKQRQNQKFLQALGDGIRLKRVEASLSQEQLGERCDVHRTYITEIENGLRNVSILTIEKIARALNVSAWQLLRFDQSINDDQEGDSDWHPDDDGDGRDGDSDGRDGDGKTNRQ